MYSDDIRLDVTNYQPRDNLDLGSLDFRHSIPHHEQSREALLDHDHEQNHPYEYDEPSEEHDGWQWRRVSLPAILAFVPVLGMLALTYALLFNGESDSLVRRQTGGSHFKLTRTQTIILITLTSFITLLVIILLVWYCKFRNSSMKNSKRNKIANPSKSVNDGPVIDKDVFGVNGESWGPIREGDPEGS